MRRLIVIGAASIFWALPLGAQEPPVKPQAGDKTDDAISRGVAYLVSRQDKDGAIHEPNQPQNLTAMTSLAILAMVAAGHEFTDDTKEGAALKKALVYVLRPDRQDPDGYFGGKDGSRMYGHGITSLMLCEMLGMGLDDAQDQVLRDRARKSIDLILRSQRVPKDVRHQGGWRYEPTSSDSDLSVTVWQLMALRSAKNAGLLVPKDAIDLAVGYVKRCYHSRHLDDGSPENLRSAFGYESGQPPTFAMAAAGLLSLQVCGQYEIPEVAGSADWLKERKLNYDSEWLFYGTYYYAQGMFQRGGQYAARARKGVEEVLLPRQGRDGAWTAKQGIEQGTGKVYTTSLAVLALAVKCHYMPIYQR